MSKFVPLSVLLMALMLWATFRRVRLMIYPMVVVLLGLRGAAGEPSGENGSLSSGPLVRHGDPGAPFARGEADEGRGGCGALCDDD
jgi:hypothetical protein